MADIFDVIADPTRRRLLGVLLERAAGGISVGGIVERLELSQPTVSKHLKVLRDHGLVTVREERQHRYYSLDAAPLGAVGTWIGPYLDEPEATDTAEAAASGVEGTAVYGAWAGVDAGESLGRRLADGSHQARTLVQGAGERVGRLPVIARKRLFRKR